MLKVILIGLLKKAAQMVLPAVQANILHGEKPMPGRTVSGIRICVDGLAVRAFATVPTRRTIPDQRCVARQAIARMLLVFRFRQFTALGTDKNIFRMPDVFSQEIPGEQIEPFMTLRAGSCLDPEKIFCMGVGRSAERAAGPIEGTDLRLQGVPQCRRRIGIFLQIEVLDLPVDDPPGHGIDVVSEDVATGPVGFQERGAAAHEGIGDAASVEVVSFIKAVLQGF
jgi:hypothetical protein